MSFSSGKSKALMDNFLSAYDLHNHRGPSQSLGSQVRGKSSQSLEKMTSDATVTELTQALRLASGEDVKKFCNLLQAIFIGIGQNASDKRKRLSIFKECVEISKSAPIGGKLGSESIKILVSEMFELGVNEVPVIIESIIKALENTGVSMIRDIVARLENEDSSSTSLACFGLLPRLMDLVQDGYTYTVKIESGDSVQMKGTKYKDHVLSQMLNLQWPSYQAAHLVSTLMEIRLTETQMQVATSKVLRLIERVHFQELPSLVYQLLLLATTQSTKHKKWIVTEMLTRFDRLEREIENNEDRTRELRHIQGTTLLHLNFAAKQDQTVGKTVLQIFKDDSWMPTPFRVALMLSMATIHRFRDATLKELKNWVTSSSMYKHENSRMMWFKKMTDSESECGWSGTSYRV